MQRLRQYWERRRVELMTGLVALVIFTVLVLAAIQVVRKQYEPFFLEQPSWVCTRIGPHHKGTGYSGQCTRYERALQSR